MLSTQFKSQVEAVSASLINADTTSKELFMLGYKEFSKANDIKALNKEINKYLKETIKSDTIRRGVQRVLNVSRKYCELKAITWLDRANYENIRQVVSLLHYAHKKDEDVYKQIKRKLAGVKKSDDMVDYNNKLSTRIQELRAEYKLVLTDSDNVVEVNLSTLMPKVEQLSVEDKQKLLERLQQELNAEAAA